MKQNFLSRHFASLLAVTAILLGTLTTSLLSSCSNEDLPATQVDPDNIDLMEPLTIEAAEDGEVDLYQDIQLPEPVYYSVNGGEKQEVTVVDEEAEEKVEYTTLNLKAGDKVQLFSRNTWLHDNEKSRGFSLSFETACYVYGNVMSLITPNGNWAANKEIKAPYALTSLFSYTNIVTHPTRQLLLPATRLTKGCYSHMFSNSKIRVAPELPANRLAERCYSFMFNYCKNLKKAPAIKGTHLAKSCYAYMFWACDGLIEAPELPATKMAESCYEFMFGWCTSLAAAPELPATQLANDCYAGMFASCEAITKAPELPATTLAPSCYSRMFSGCTKLTEAPLLPATELVDSCYSAMFSESGLKVAPVLPATTMARSCYEGMFGFCNELTQAPALPATELAARCYAHMFTRCKNLTGTVELPAEQLPERCYSFMFSGCAKLNSVKCMATTMTGDFALGSWLENAGTDESVGTRTLTHAAGTSWTVSDEYARGTTDWFVPTGWTLVSM